MISIWLYVLHSLLYRAIFTRILLCQFFMVKLKVAILHNFFNAQIVVKMISDKDVEQNGRC